MGIWVFEFENGFGIEEVVPREKRVESSEVGLNIGYLPLIKLLKDGRGFGR